MKTAMFTLWIRAAGRINSTELVAAMIDQQESFADGLLYAQERIQGSMSILILTPKGIYASRDRRGRTPVTIGKKDGAFCVSFENFAYLNLGYSHYSELGPGEINFITPGRRGDRKPGQKGNEDLLLPVVLLRLSTASYEGVTSSRCGISADGFWPAAITA